MEKTTITTNNDRLLAWMATVPAGKLPEVRARIMRGLRYLAIRPGSLAIGSHANPLPGAPKDRGYRRRETVFVLTHTRKSYDKQRQTLRLDRE